MNPRLIRAMEIICRRLYHLNEENTEMLTCNIKSNVVEAEFRSDIAVLKIKVPRAIVEDFAQNEEEINE